MTGSGIGMTYDKTRDVLAILNQADRPRRSGRDRAPMPPRSRRAAPQFARREKNIHFERDVKLQRAGQIDRGRRRGGAISTDDEKQIESMELRGHARGSRRQKPAPGGLQALTGRDMDLKYGPDGTDARARRAHRRRGDHAGRRDGRSRAGKIKANTIDIALAPDGSTPTSLDGARGGVS